MLSGVIGEDDCSILQFNDDEIISDIEICKDSVGIATYNEFVGKFEFFCVETRLK